MATGPFVIDVTEATFEEDVLRRSEEVPVVVDLWAAWCGPCRTLSPLLERLATEAAGAWILAKVDVDTNPRLAQAYRAQSIPMVVGIRNRKAVSEFVGAIPEQQIRAWLAQLGPTQGEIAAEEGGAAESAGDLDAAAERYRYALQQEPANAAARAGLARVELALRTREGIDPAALKARLERDPTDVEAATALADGLFARDEVDLGAALLIQTVLAVTGEDRERVRRHLVGLLDALPPEDPRALRARRDLANALF